MLLPSAGAGREAAASPSGKDLRSPRWEGEERGGEGDSPAGSYLLAFPLSRAEGHTVRRYRDGRWRAMTTCPKCGAANPDTVTRCTACKAILPVKLGTASQELYERSGLRATHVQMRCPHCAAENPYTRTRCQQCGGLLTKKQRHETPYRKWLYLAIGAVVLIVLFVATRQG